MADEYLWPVRNVAEHSYCPRLFYLMEVEGLHEPSSDTVEGLAIHQRVDRPSPETSLGGEDAEPESVRSLTLTNKDLNLTATIDLVEHIGQLAVPVEYRKGRPQAFRNEAGGQEWRPWTTDLVQVGLQSKLLIEAGYQVEQAILYYAAIRRRISVVVDQELLERADAEFRAARLTAAGPRPAPLRHDPKCNGCSLQPLCLPDEVNLDEVPDLAPARLPWPPRSEGIVVVVQSQGVKVGIRNGAFTVHDAEGQKLAEQPIASVESVALLGNVQISTQAIHTLADRGIPLAFLTQAGRLTAMVDPLDSVSALVRRAQVLRTEDQQARLMLARALIEAKVRNQRTLLQRNGRNPAGLEDLADYANDCRESDSIESLRGTEGIAARVYFQSFASMIEGEYSAEFQSHGRQRRPPPDPVNAVLSLSYTMLAHESVAALRQARLEPAIGAYHSGRPGRPALALDLMEPFRPLVADSITISLFNRGELTEGSFKRTSIGCVLTDSGRRSFFGAWQRRMQTEVTHPLFGYKLSYRRMLILHARMIASWFLGEIRNLSFLTTR